MRWLVVLLLLFCYPRAHAQDAQSSLPAPAAQSDAQLSPQAAYEEASRPLDIVRRPVTNWSEVEQAALAVATAKAKDACAARSPYQYTGEDLLAYARLCAFAQLWQPVQQAATDYLIAQNAATAAEKITNFPNLSMAFDYEVQASLHLKNPANAFGTAQTMLRTVVYDGLASEAVNSTVRYVQLIQTDEALALLKQRQPLLLAMLKARAAPATQTARTSAAAAAPASSRPPLSIHELYADAIQLPAMQQFANDPVAAVDSFAELEATLPTKISPDDAFLTAVSRRQYKLLGAPLPEIVASVSLLDTASPKPPDLNRKAAGATAFLIFPDWCAQCVAINPLFAQATASLKQDGVHFFALLAQDQRLPSVESRPTKTPSKTAVAATKPAKTRPIGAPKATTPTITIQAGTKPTAAEQLTGTPTLIVPTATLDTIAATDYPMLLVTDGHGIVRYVGAAPDNVLVEGGLIYQVVERILEQWPVPHMATSH